MSTLTADPIHPETKIPDLLREHPELRPVLDRYGLAGCGGPLGPNESLAYFARAHGIEEAVLYAELEGALGSEPPQLLAPAGAHYAPGIADTIYQRFFKAGIAIVLSAGALWGAVLLLRIAFSKSFTAISIHDINAHGHAQIFGWIGLFVMGFAYQAFPRFKHTTLPHPKLAVASFWLMVSGIALRVLSEPFVSEGRTFVAVGIAAGLLELVAIGAFVGVMLETLRRGNAREPMDAWVVASLFFFVVQGIGDVLHFAATSIAASTEALVATVATWQPPLRDVQIHGFAMLMVLAVSQRFLPGMYGYRKVSPRASRVTLALLLAAIVGEVTSWLWMRATEHRSVGAGIALMASTLLLAAAALSFGWRLGIYGRCPEPDRSSKFLKTAYVWLAISFAMLLFMPAYLALTHIPFSHAYAGAVRHAITVGFLSLMILGVAGKVVPTLCGVDVRSLGSLTLPFVLVNVGCSMRVGFQVLTDFAPNVAFPLAGVSGVLEVTGIGIWGIGLWRMMSRRAAEDRSMAAADEAPAARPTEVRASDRVGPLVAAAPELLEVFVLFGFTPLQNPLFRRTLARQITISQACAMHGLDAAKLVASLNARLQRAAPPSEAIDSRVTVADVLRRFPGTAPVFARHHIDACCGGTKPIAVVCEKHGIPLEVLLAELEAAALPSKSAG
jgi:NnrS protein/uncharacterized protein DUF542/uncharacterized protein DUF1858